MTTEAKKSKTELKGHFRLGCHPSVAVYALNPALAIFYRRFNRIDFQLIHDLSRIICEQIISNKIDFGLVVNPIPHPELIIKNLEKDQVAFWRAPKANADTLIYNPEIMQSQSLLKKIKNAEFRRSITSNSLEVIASLANSGAGTAILPTRVAQANSNFLKRIDEMPYVEDTISFVYRSDIEKSESVRIVIEFLKKVEF